MNKKDTTNPILANYLNSVENAQVASTSAAPVAQDEFREGRHAVNEIRDSSGFFSLDMERMPMAMFYPLGTRIMIRPATTGEIQAYSVVDNSNLYDITVKMNEILASCVRFVNPDGSYSSYREVKDGDRIYIVTEIARATASKGTHLVQEAVCPGCKTLNTLEMNAKTFVMTEPDQAFIEKYFNGNTGVFDFKMKNGTEFSLSPPTVGLAMDIHAYVLDQVVAKKQKLNVSFMKCMPWTMSNRSSISIEEATQEETKYERMNKDLFMAIDASVDKMKFGITELKAKCVQCGSEVRTPFTFPGGASSLFIIPNAFDELIG